MLFINNRESKPLVKRLICEVHHYLNRMFPSELAEKSISIEEYRNAFFGKIRPIVPTVTGKLDKKYLRLLAMKLACKPTAMKEEEKCFEVIDRILRIVSYLVDKNFSEKLFYHHLEGYLHHTAWLEKKRKIPYVLERNNKLYSVFFNEDATAFEAILYAEYGYLKGLTVLFEKSGSQLLKEIVEKALFEAATWGHLKVVKFLLHHSAEVISVKAIEAAISNASYYNHVLVVAYFLNRKTKEQQISEPILQKAFLMFARCNHEEMLCFLLDPEWKNLKNIIEKALVEAACCDATQAVIFLLKSQGDKISLDCLLKTLYDVVSTGDDHIEIINILLGEIVDARLKKIENNRENHIFLKMLEEAFVKAVCRGSLKVVSLFLEKERFYISPETLGNALHKAVFLNLDQIVQIILVEKGAHILTGVIEDELYQAAQTGHISVFRFFLEFKGEEITVDILERSFIIAVRENHPEIVRFLLQEKEDFISAEIVEKTFLKIAPLGSREVLQVLIESGKGKQFPFLHKCKILFSSVFQRHFSDSRDFFWPKRGAVVREIRVQTEAGAQQEALQHSGSLLRFQRMHKEDSSSNSDRKVSMSPVFFLG